MLRLDEEPLSYQQGEQKRHSLLLQLPPQTPKPDDLRPPKPQDRHRNQPQEKVFHIFIFFVFFFRSSGLACRAASRPASTQPTLSQIHLQQKIHLPQQIHLPQFKTTNLVPNICFEMFCSA